MKNYNCVKCGYGSLVRSNFKATPHSNYYCASEEHCLARLRVEVAMKRVEENDDLYVYGDNADDTIEVA